MRISVEKRTKGNATWQRLQADGSRITVLLDGVLQMHCLMADDKTGEIKRYIANQHGDIVEDEATGEMKTELVTGKVEIRIA